MRSTLYILISLSLAVALAGCGTHRSERRPTADIPPPCQAAERQLPGKDLDEHYEALELVAQMKYAQAKEVFQRLWPAFSESGQEALAAEACFWEGYCREMLQQPGSALNLYQHVLSRWPMTAAATQATLRIALLTSA